MRHHLNVAVWLPFGLVTNKPLMLGAFLVGSFYTTHSFFNVALFLVMMVIFGAALPIELRLRPTWPQKSGLMPPRQAPIAPTLAQIAVRVKGKAPKAARIARQLAPELQALLKGKIDKQPEAIVFQDRQVQAQA